MKPDINNLAKTYFDSLDKPELAREKPQFCICVIGLVGAGKSTVLRKIATRLPNVLVSGDEVRKLIYESGLPSQTSEFIAQVNSEVVERLAKLGYRLSYDNDFANTEIRNPRREKDKQLNLREIWIRVDPPESFIINKLHNYKHTYLFKDAGEAVATYYRRKELHQKEANEISKLPFVYTFDPSLPTIDGQIAEAVERINSLLKTEL